jgi:hypothetical protein
MDSEADVLENRRETKTSYMPSLPASIATELAISLCVLRSPVVSTRAV